MNAGRLRTPIPKAAAHVGRGIEPLIDGRVERGSASDLDGARVLPWLILWTAISLVLCGLAAPLAWTQVSAQSWAVVPGVVVRSQHETNQSDWHPLLEYEYFAGGRSRRSSEVGWPTPGSKHDERPPLEYRKGDSISVYVDSSDPDRSLLAPGLGRLAVFYLSVCQTLATAALAGWACVMAHFLRSRRFNWIGGFVVEDTKESTTASAGDWAKTLEFGAMGVILSSAACSAIAAAAGTSWTYLIVQFVVCVFLGGSVMWLQRLISKREPALRIDWVQQTVWLPSQGLGSHGTSIAIAAISRVGLRRSAARHTFVWEVVLETAAGPAPVVERYSKKPAQTIVQWLALVLRVPGSDEAIGA